MRETPRQMTGEDGAGTTRRDFLGTAGAAALVPGFTILSPEARGANDRIGIGFIGTGGRAQAHLDIVNSLKQQGKAAPVAVCDVYRPRLEAASKKTGGAKMYMEHEALLADPDVDVVCIATPDRLHAPQTIDAIRAGKDVYCEKPLTHWSQFELARKVNDEAPPREQGREVRCPDAGPDHRLSHGPWGDDAPRRRRLPVLPHDAPRSS
jgi:Oxidoreductase family, NAD-binding Rossmann fold